MKELNLIKAKKSLTHKNGLFITEASGMNAPNRSAKRQKNSNYCQFGCQTLLNLLDGLDKTIEGVIENKDIECVHKTRVGSRKAQSRYASFSTLLSPKNIQEMAKTNKKSNMPTRGSKRLRRPNRIH